MTLENKKTLRHFQCRDYLWELFERMSQELECSPDYLINEAMRQYARSRDYHPQAAQARPQARPPQPPAPPTYNSGGGGNIPSLSGRGGPPRPPAPPKPPPTPYGQGAPGGYNNNGYGGRPPAPGGGAYPSPGGNGPPAYRGAAAAPPVYPAPGGGQRPPPYGGAQQQPPAGGYPPMGGGHRPQLYCIFNGQKVPVTKDEFVIGRGTKTADLPIKDGNISRRHAAVVFQDNSWFIKDLGSTNGVEYSGRRLDSKRIDEGDVFQLCDYELRFTYR